MYLLTRSSRRVCVLKVGNGYGYGNGNGNGNGKIGRSFREREYHDESFGYRPVPSYVFPDYTPNQIKNRHINAPLLRYVDSMRTHGHRAANIDPLDIIEREPGQVGALDPKRYGLERGSEKVFDVDGIIWNEMGEGKRLWKLEEVEDHLRNVYVGRIGYEYMHSPSKTERLWFSHLLESKNLPEEGSKRDSGPPVLNVVSEERKKRIWEILVKSEVFDRFLQAKFPNLKRYGLEGGESMLPALDTLFDVAAQSGIGHIMLAMPHRGRLNLLAGLLDYSPSALFHKIRGGSEWPTDLDIEGDVLSHLVSSPVLGYEDSKVKVSLLPNPSHLEAANPVALGKTRAKQFSLLKTSPESCQLGDKVMCVQLHGDASFTGQGVVMESLGLSNLPHFTSGGSVHIVVDNNIGYTTPASNARSSLYCSDIGKMINAPVLHVNGDYPEDVARAMDIAFRYRNYFRKDIIVDLLVYRRWGHNELDLPGITSPLMYEQIAARKSVPELYEHKLLTENVITQEDITNTRTEYKSYLESKLTSPSPITSSPPSFAPNTSMLQSQWSNISWSSSTEAKTSSNISTGVELDILKKVGEASVWMPNEFEVHNKVMRHVKNRKTSLEKGVGLDWATAEALAFGSLMIEGYDVRISGQDVGRGTFSHRHAMLVNQKTEGVVVPLNEALDGPGKLELANSSLSEFAVLGFEYGASWERPTLLPIWEAQFGDFFNGAQVIIDTYIASSETKWLRQSGIVLMLPHGLDGAGPEHSSCRMERMLQLTNDKYFEVVERKDLNDIGINMHVVFPTTPAQYFHLLRRQMKRKYRKPLVIVGPKGLLRLAAASSSLEDFKPNTKFQPILSDPISKPEETKRVVLLTGKLYYELIKERSMKSLDSSIDFVRIEELAPFPFTQLRQVLESYQSESSTDGKKKKKIEVVWVQEECRNQGAWGHVKERIESVLESLKEKGMDGVEFVWKGYLGRKESAIPAPGIGEIYKKQQKEVLDSVFEGL